MMLEAPVTVFLNAIFSLSSIRIIIHDDAWKKRYESALLIQQQRRESIQANQAPDRPHVSGNFTITIHLRQPRSAVEWDSRARPSTQQWLPNKVHLRSVRPPRYRKNPLRPATAGTHGPPRQTAMDRDVQADARRRASDAGRWPQDRKGQNNDLHGALLLHQRARHKLQTAGDGRDVPIGVQPPVRVAEESKKVPCPQLQPILNRLVEASRDEMQTSRATVHLHDKIRKPAQHHHHPAERLHEHFVHQRRREHGHPRGRP